MSMFQPGFSTLYKGVQSLSPPPSDSGASEVVPATLVALKNCQAASKFPSMELSIVSVLTSQKHSKSGVGNCVNSYIVKRYLQERGLRLLISDKERKFVLCKEEYFLARASDFLRLSHAEVLQTDPTPSVLRKARKIASLPSISTLPGHVDSLPNVACPRLFFEVKTHKENWPLRLLVNKRSHPTYHLETAVAKLLSGLLPPSPLVMSSSIAAKATISSVLDNLSHSNYNFYKMDMVALYPSVPQFEVVMLANAMLVKEGFTAQQILEIREALIFITENNYFRFNGKIYLQKQGVPMGSPLY
ncbi:uncharacterized protein LOC111620847 [Centruroides sculpturatus]|uniref:uncharacterized protein LOC111620847 n=1 Tax=Centruroides sculpturatus TaxID=218467 RepID=UPI000C6E2071|nr:uncharacterized protein LOC111620847 [Centruroides sculpturatus]